MFTSQQPDVWLRWGLDQNVAFFMDKWFILKNQNWILLTCDSFPLKVSHMLIPKLLLKFWILFWRVLFRGIKDEIFCFALLRWHHNGWASNILSGGCRRTTTIKILDAHPLWHHRRWAKPKISSFSLILSYNCVIFAFYRWDLFLKNIITSFHWFH